MRRRTTLHTTSRATNVATSAHDAWLVVASGYDRPQWYVDASPLVFRGELDRFFGGDGAHHRPPATPVLSTGDAVGFWKVQEADHDGRRLALEAVVRAPGHVELVTTVTPLAEARCRVSQSVTFTPRGFLGRAYLVADLPAREVMLELVHRRLLVDILAARTG